MKKLFLFILVFLILSSAGITSAKDLNESLLTFRAKKSDLWFTNSDYTKDKKDFIEIKLKGKLYNPKIEIPDVEWENKVDRRTLTGAAASFFSASKAADLTWILNNYVKEDRKIIKDFYKKDKKTILAGKVRANWVKSKQIKGEAYYKDYVFLFIEQEYKDGSKAIEPMVCVKRPEGWLQTQALLNDKTYDTVFAALNSGEVF